MRLKNRPGGVMKIILIILIVLLVIAGVGVFMVLKNLDKLAHVAITEGVSFILNVPVTLAKVDIDLKSGSVEMEKLVIENPRGFQKEHAFSLGKIKVQADLNSFRSELPVIEAILIENPEITLEYGIKGSNFDQLIENANRFTLQNQKEEASANGAASDAAPASSNPSANAAEMNLLVKNFSLADADVNLAASAFSFQKEYGLEIPPVNIANIGGSNATAAEVTRHVLKEVLAAILRSNDMPSDFSSIVDDPKKFLEARAQQEVDKLVDKGKDQVDKAIESGKNKLNEELDKLAGQNKMLDKAIDEGKKALDDVIGDNEGKLDTLIDQNVDKLTDDAKKKAEEKAKEELEKLKKKFGW